MSLLLLSFSPLLGCDQETTGHWLVLLPSVILSTTHWAKKKDFLDIRFSSIPVRISRLYYLDGCRELDL